MFCIFVMYLVFGLCYGFDAVEVNWASPYVDILVGMEYGAICFIYAAFQIGKFKERYGRLPKGKEWFSYKW